MVEMEALVRLRAENELSWVWGDVQAWLEWLVVLGHVIASTGVVRLL